MSAKRNSKTGKNTQKGNTPAEVGFLPCFARYRFDKYPIDTAYLNKTFISKLGTFLSIILTTPNPQQLQSNGACHKTILLKPDDAESRKIISDCASPESKIYRAGFGDNKMRIIFGLEHNRRLCHIFALDANHDTFNGKNR
jgi:hypothetical protein